MREHMYLVLSLILHLLFLVMVTLVPEEQLKSVRDPYEKRTQALKKIQVAMLERKVEEDQKKAEEAKKLADAQKPGTELTPRPVDEKPTSKLVTEDQVEKNKKIADTALTRVMGQQQDLLNQVLDAAGPGLGGGMMGIRVIGDRGMDAELALGLDAFGGTLGGGGGGGFRGTGAWGGGGEFGAADLRGISGLSKSDAEGAASKIKFKGGGEPMVYTGISTVSGELDKETVRRYIQTKMDQVRWCYQQEVQKNPDLAGQVKIEWIILPTGKVTAVRVGVSSLGSQAVEQCLMSRVATWQFPSPKGGGTVKVSYPFIFRVTGGK
jgi:TonB family protein